MTIAIITPVGNHTFDVGGAQIRAYCRPLATVVTVRGEIDADNVDLLGDWIARFIPGQNAVVLDMSGVSSCTVAGFSLLPKVDAGCSAAGVEWAVITSPAVTELLSDDNPFPITHSIHEALHDLADEIVDRRQLVLPLIKKTA